MVGPCALGRTMCEGTEVRISRSMGVGEVAWGGAERHREGAVWEFEVD